LEICCKKIKKCGKVLKKNANQRNKMQPILTKNAAFIIPGVQAIGKHKHIIFRHLSTAVDSTVCHNINKTVLQSIIKLMKIIFRGICPNYTKKV